MGDLRTTDTTVGATIVSSKGYNHHQTRPLRVILSGEKNARIFLKVETRRANGNAVWISQKIELSLINNGIPNQLTVRSDRKTVALRVSTSGVALRSR